MINVLPTLQIADAKYPNIFAVGDVSNTGPVNRRDYKGHVDVVAQNIMALIQKTKLEEYQSKPPKIHVTVGTVISSVFFV